MHQTGAIGTVCHAMLGSRALDHPRFLDVGGLEVACYESAGTAGPGILLVHGNSSSARAYSEQLEGPLGQELRVVALDLPGHGNSARASRDPAAIYRIPGYAAVVAAVAERLDLTRGVFVGWSLGGDIVLQAIVSTPVSPLTESSAKIGHFPIGS